MQLSVVIPSRERERVLSETLRRLLEQVAGKPVEVIVVYDGPSGERRIATETAGAAAVPLRVARAGGARPGRGPQPGRAMAAGEAVLFLGDDAWPGDGLIDRHLGFHRANPDPGAALLGRLEPAPPLDGSAFVRWLHTGGVQFGYGELEPGEVTPAIVLDRERLGEGGAAPGGWGASTRSSPTRPARTWSSASGWPARGCASATTRRRWPLHYHPTDLAATLGRMRRVGRAYRVLERKAPQLPMPSRPSARHRLKAAALTPLAAAGVAQRDRPGASSATRPSASRSGTSSRRRGRALAIGDGLARAEMRRMPASRRAGAAADVCGGRGL